MRTVRALAAALAAAAMLPAVGAAQQNPHPFQNAWFWGVKGGQFFASPASNQNLQQSISWGADWLITRTHAGLYVSGVGSLFTRTAYLPRLTQDDTVGVHPVTLKNLRRFDLLAMVFPGSSDRVHPYAGLGFSINEVANATLSDTAVTADEYAVAQSAIQQFRTSVSPMLMLGTQVRLPLVSFFVQGAAVTTNNQFFLGGKHFNLTYEVGLRYNVGTSIDRF